jgi:hypothetical protein
MNEEQGSDSLPTITGYQKGHALGHKGSLIATAALVSGK